MAEKEDADRNMAALVAIYGALFLPHAYHAATTPPAEAGTRGLLLCLKALCASAAGMGLSFAATSLRWFKSMHYMACLVARIKQR